MNEAAYLDAVRNCHNWNGTALRDRVTRIPYFDQQTNIIQVPGHLIRNPLDRIESASPDKVYEYPAIKFKKRKRNSPLIPELVRKVEEITPETAVVQPEREAKEGVTYADMDSMSDVNDDLLDDSPEEEYDDDISYTTRRRKGAPPKKRKSTAPKASRMPAGAGATVTTQPIQRTTSDEKPYACINCGARYKSKPGLNYHMAHVHQQFESFRSEANNAPEAASAASNYCDFCLGDTQLNKKTGQPEELISCHDCGRAGHPVCLQFTPNMIISTKKYGWQCIECKSCAICGTSDNDDQLLFCDDCDRGFHLYCLQPPLNAPPDGEWSCHLCQVEFGEQASAPTRQMFQTV